MMHWSAQFTGLPWREHGRAFDGVDCYGLVCLVYSKLGILLPTYESIGVNEKSEIALAVAAEASSILWRKIPYKRERSLDVVVFRRGEHASHIGLIAKPPMMLHVTRETGGSCVERYDTGKWLSRIDGLYRYCGPRLH